MDFVGNIDLLKRDSFAYRVYDKLHSILEYSDSILYYMFPVYTGDIDMGKVEATLLLLSKEYGVFYFDTIRDGETVDFTEERINTLYSCIASCFRKSSVLKKRRDSLKYDISTIIVSDAQVTVSDEFLNITYNNIKDTLNECKYIIDDDAFGIMQSCIEGSLQAKKKVIRRTSTNKLTKGEILNSIQEHIARFDLEQKQAALIEIEGPQRIRGLAGSGKTVVLAQKAALHHLRYPNDKILYTYYTKALHDTIKEHISRAYRYFSENKEPNWNNIFICHAWGGVSVPGTYSMACMDNEASIQTFSEAIRINSRDPLGGICEELMRNHSINPKYDLILIDEGQDFTAPFYQLCYKLSKNKKIVWAYDDFQNIFDVKIQDERETFGKDAEEKYNVDFERDKYVNQDIVLKKCYRTPRYSLIAAFSLGLGIYNDKVLQRLDTNEHWSALGFNVKKGNCVEGDEMVIERPTTNTPSYSNDNFKEGSICYKCFSNITEESRAIARNISNDITEENLRPEDICVICLDKKCVSDYFQKIEYFLDVNGIRSFNLLNTSNGNLSFTRENSVTLTTVNKAKGNEKGAVYICGADYIFMNPNNVVLRDVLFTAMTRTKGWLNISGCSEDFNRCNAELMLLKENDYELHFIQPSEAETKTIENHSRVQADIYQDFGKNIERLRQTGLSPDEILKQLKRLLANDKK